MSRNFRRTVKRMRTQLNEAVQITDELRNMFHAAGIPINFVSDLIPATRRLLGGAAPPRPGHQPPALPQGVRPAVAPTQAVASIPGQTGAPPPMSQAEMDEIYQKKLAKTMQQAQGYAVTEDGQRVEVPGQVISTQPKPLPAPALDADLLEEDDQPTPVPASTDGRVNRATGLSLADQRKLLERLGVRTEAPKPGALNPKAFGG